MSATSLLITFLLFYRTRGIIYAITGMSSIRLIGTIKCDLNKNLGNTGISSKTNAYVYKGRILQKSFAGSTIVDREAVAVKKISCGNENNFHIHLKEVSVMLKCDEHPNIVQYYCRETDNLDFQILIAMELCLGTVQDLMDSKIAEIGPDDISDVKLLHQIAKGVEYLHGREPEAIIHRDLKPTNILLKIVAKEVCVKLCDFGISRVLPSKKTSVTLETNSGSVGWSSPEVLRAQPRTTSANDVGRPRLS
ncbi:Serine/threonine-protein kinase/endoribonuclease IRE1 [Orchesella cincta]|uniref:Serine/threonine-protein kinase/endoribonuclease IRE1 n=1 Tax=Orchesella cincta TaxID=48709 RepID=A0A1D2MBR2_ORCCI|nr:Serine/threonine-protein kinase/endoribonuclease IRE1 [Orchesella cincta]